jgi:hypothetical protein
MLELYTQRNTTNRIAPSISLFSPFGKLRTGALSSALLGRAIRDSASAPTRREGIQYFFNAGDELFSLTLTSLPCYYIAVDHRHHVDSEKVPPRCPFPRGKSSALNLPKGVTD